MQGSTYKKDGNKDYPSMEYGGKEKYMKATLHLLQVQATNAG